jgi:hypothetical protein
MMPAGAARVWPFSDLQFSSAFAAFAQAPI